MYVCLCNGFTERDVRQVLSQGATSPSRVCRALGCGPQCGRCKAHIHSLIEEYRRGGTGPAPGDARSVPVAT